MFSLWMVLLASRALRNSPGEYCKRITRQAEGARLMCTLKIVKKMPIRTAGPPMKSWWSSGVTSTSLPSAGETMSPGAGGICRDGSRKNHVTSTSNTAGATAIYESHPLQRCFQDVHVLSQHLQGRLAHYTLIGRHWLGLGVDDDTSF